MSATEPPGRGMRFAEGQLRRHGWRRGRGLGKREDGIAEAIRVKVKCDTAGVGHDAAEPFSFHWWDHVFNKAAANIAVEAGQDSVAMKTLSEQGAWISTKKPRKAGGTGSMLYGRFVKSATLTASGEESAKLPTGSESSEEEEEEKLDLSSARRLTDEELMRACGGRTAHKGARHGLTMSAKLARLEEQERAFLATYRRKEQQREPPENSPPAEGQKTIKEKKKQSRDRANPELLQHQEPSGEEELAGEEGKVVKRKKKKKQEPSREEEVAGKEEKPAKRRKKKKQEPSREEEVAGKEEKPAKRRKKKKKQEEEDEELDEPEKKKKKQQQEEEDKEPEKKKRQHREEEEDKEEPKKKKEEDKEEPAETELPLEDTDGSDHAGHRPRKKRKKRKREPE
ncbi:G patch domain-containing protein 4 [Falco biarmicus]|uniref:G patch domain-containing protein 4 n=1 Tax=Falco biarmicus TaxID=345155 RepID=UPI0024BCDA7F|nr:G patch domain-containing protein 4 [Falco biarmicus]